jgi:sec-independent protein translocase protein TatA
MVSIMFGIGVWELLIVLGILLLLFGTRLPSLARSMGKSITEFKRGMHDDDAATTDRIEQK